MMGHDEIWWGQVPGCMRLIQLITDHLCGGKTVWVSGKEPAWPEAFRGALKNSMYALGSGVSFSMLDAGSLPCGGAPVEALRQHICGLDAAPSFFKDSLADLVRSLPEPDIVIWLYGLPSESTARWLDLSAALAARKDVRLTLACQIPAPQAVRKNVLSVTPEAAVGPFDMQYFAITLLSRQPHARFLTEYASGLIAEIAQKDAPLCSELCMSPHDLLRSPYDTCRALMSACDERHIRASLRAAQLKYVLPLVEKKRLSFIECLGTRGEDLLPFSDDFENQINTPPEIELRHLVYFQRQGSLRLSEKEEACLRRLYDVRNRLAHLLEVPYEAILCIQEEPLLLGY